MDSVASAVIAFAAFACWVALLLGAAWWRRQIALRPEPAPTATLMQDAWPATVQAPLPAQPSQIQTRRDLLEKTLGNWAFDVEETPTLPMARVAGISEFPAAGPAPLDAVVHPALSR